MTASGALAEFPISAVKVVRTPMCFFGGGYLRLFPYHIMHRMSRRVLDEGRPVIFYIHPREIDPDHPRLPLTLKRKFTSYINLQSTRPKLERLLADFEVTSFGKYMEAQALQ
jgi:hypothetical protein